MSKKNHSTSNTKFFVVKRRINFHSARQIFDGVAVATARKSNIAEGNLGKFNIKILNIRCTMDEFCLMIPILTFLETAKT